MKRLRGNNVIYFIGLLSILISTYGCKQNTEEVISGDLYFSFFRIGSYYNLPDSIIKKAELQFKNLKVDSLTDSEEQLFDNHAKIKKANLLYNPYVDLIIGEDSIVKLYLDTISYLKFKGFKLADLEKKHEKVSIEAFVKKIDAGLYYCTKLKKVEVVKGETQTTFKDPKFKIEDYN